MKQEVYFKDLLMHTFVGSTCENSPCQVAFLKEAVNYDKLLNALKITLDVFPLMKSTITNDKGLCFKTIENPYPIVNCKLEDRPRKLGKSANGYMWRLTYYDKAICLDTAHSMSDGRGWMSFFTTLINAYFGVNPQSNLNSNEERFEDKLVKGVETYAKRKQAKGFKRKNIKYDRNGDKKATCHLLIADTKQVLDAVHKIDATPAIVFAPIFSRVLRNFINPKAKNKNVSCLLPVDARNILGFNTTHNGFVEAYITYIDKFDDIEIGKLSTIYRAILDLQVQPESIMHNFSKQIKTYKPILFHKNKYFLKVVGAIGGYISKNNQCNFVISYLGKSYFDESVNNGIDAYYWHSWHQFQDSNIAMVDFNGSLYMTITEDYIHGDEIVDEFIKECNSVGINLKEIEKRSIELVTIE